MVRGSLLRLVGVGGSSGVGLSYAAGRGHTLSHSSSQMWQDLATNNPAGQAPES